MIGTLKKTRNNARMTRNDPGRQGTPQTTRNNPRKVTGWQGMEERLASPKKIGKLDKKSINHGWLHRVSTYQMKTEENEKQQFICASLGSADILTSSQKTSPKKIWKSREKTTISHGWLLRWEDMKWEQKKKKNNNLPVQQRVDAKAGCPANWRPRLDAQQTRGQSWMLEEESDDNNNNQPV